MTIVTVGIIGCGRDLEDLVAAFENVPGVEVIGVGDANVVMLGRVLQRHPRVAVTTDDRQVIEDDGIAAIAIDAHPADRARRSLDVLAAGKHALVAADTTLGPVELEALTNEAGRAGRLFMAGEPAAFVEAVRASLDDEA